MGMQDKGGFIVHEKQEVHVDGELWEVLEKERVGTHELTESNWFLEHRDGIVNAERVKHSCQ